MLGGEKNDQQLAVGPRQGPSALEFVVPMEGET